MGKPQMPVVARLVAIPGDKRVKVNILEAKYEILSGYNVYPAQPPLPDIIRAKQSEFVIDKDFYSKDVFYPEEVGRVGKPMIWRDYRVVNLVCNPVRFNPTKGELKVCRKIKVELEYSGFSDVNVLKRPPSPTPTFEKLYKEFIINYNFLNWEGLLNTGGKYLIITHDNFYNAVLPLVNWKCKKGVQTIVTKLSEIPPGDSAAIHNYIKNAYNTWTPRPEYVLLIGDTDFLPCGIRPSLSGEVYNYYGTDHCYSLVSGNDIFSDILIGRLPANTAIECGTMADKIIKYERYPYLTQTAWYKKATTVGVQQKDRIFQETCRTIRNILLTYGYEQVDTLFEGENPPGLATPTNITNALNEGRSFLIFRGHGWMDGWYTDNNPPPLYNLYYYPCE